MSDSDRITMDAHENPPTYYTTSITVDDKDQSIGFPTETDNARSYLLKMHKCTVKKNRNPDLKEGDDLVYHPTLTLCDAIMLSPEDDANTLDSLIMERVYSRFQLSTAWGQLLKWVSVRLTDKKARRQAIPVDPKNARAILKLLIQENGNIDISFSEMTREEAEYEPLEEDKKKKNEKEAGKEAEGETKKAKKRSCNVQ